MKLLSQRIGYYTVLLALGVAYSSLKAGEKKIWSILICTLEERKESFTYIYDKLRRQIQECALHDEVEVLFLRDNRENSVGYKRNLLLQNCSGKYVSFVDDDDDVHHNYVPMIYERLVRNPDCVSLLGIITFNRQNPRYFIHSIRYALWFEMHGVYYRPPNHLNPIRKSIAQQFLFPDVYRGEDADWSMQIARSQLVKTEEFIDVPYYFYNS